MNQSRGETLRERIHESGLDSLIISKPANLRYLTGFTGDYGFLVIGPSGSTFFTSPLYVEQAHSTISHEVKVINTTGIFKTFSRLHSSFWGITIGYEAEFLTCSESAKLKEVLTAKKLIATKGMVEEFRMVKQPYELDAIQRAQQITEKVFDGVIPFIRDGVCERDLAAEIVYRMLHYGGERPAFDTIVASGPNSSLPHIHPTKRKFKMGDLIIIDMGTIVDGYASDMTRTVVLGKANQKQKKIHTLVLDSQKKAFDKVKSGVTCSFIDKNARNVIAHAGYKKHFIHSLGHGVGLEIHELPLLTAKSKTKLREGMVITLEPGVYIPQWGGVRIEDMVMVTNDGCQRITQTPRTILEI
jgi:Xaa-Pro aminopeptidase